MTNETETNMRSGSRPSPEGTTLLFAGVLRCVQLTDNRRTATKARRRTSQDQGRDKAEKTRVDRHEVVRFRWICVCLVLRGDPVWYRMICRDIVISYPISCDITRYNISRYCIHIPYFWNWYRDILSRRKISRYRTLFFAQLGAPSLVDQGSKRRVIWR